jgi:rubrerythrin
MSLDFSYRKCIKNGTLKQSDLEFAYADGTTSWSAMAYTLPWAMAVTDCGSITDTNKGEVWRRIYLWQQVHGAITRVNNEPYYLTKKHIYACVGFTCNVTTTTPAAFNKKLLAGWDGQQYQHETLTCITCGTIAHGLREDRQCPNCNPYTAEQEVA